MTNPAEDERRRRRALLNNLKAGDAVVYFSPRNYRIGDRLEKRTIHRTTKTRAYLKNPETDCELGFCLGKGDRDLNAGNAVDQQRHPHRYIEAYEPAIHDPMLDIQARRNAVSRVRDLFGKVRDEFFTWDDINAITAVLDRAIAASCSK